MSGLLDHLGLERRRKEKKDEKKGRRRVECPACGDRVAPEMMTESGVCKTCAELRRMREKAAEDLRKGLRAAEEAGEETRRTLERFLSERKVG